MRFSKVAACAAAASAALIGTPSSAATTVTYTINVSGTGALGRYLGVPGNSPFEIVSLIGSVITFSVSDATSRNVAFGGIDAAAADIQATMQGLSFGFYTPNAFMRGAVNGSGKACFNNPTSAFPLGAITLLGGEGCGAVTYSKQGTISFENFSGTITSISVSSAEGGSGAPFASVASVIPELSTWALMLAGFGMVGYALRRRPKLSYAL